MLILQGIGTSKTQRTLILPYQYMSSWYPINTLLSAIDTVERYKVVTCRVSTIWYVFIRYHKPSTQKIYTTIWVLTSSMKYIHRHKYKWNSIHSNGTRSIANISYTIYLGQIKTSVTRTSRSYFIAKTTWSNLHLKPKFQVGGCRIFLCRWNLFSHSFGYLVSPFTHKKQPCNLKVTTRKKDDVQIKMWWITDIWFLSESIHTSNIYVKW